MNNFFFHFGVGLLNIKRIRTRNSRDVATLCRRLPEGLFSDRGSFNNRSLHHLREKQNPYERAISIIGKRLSSFDEVPCYGFGDSPTSFAPIIETAIGIVDKSQGQYHNKLCWYQTIISKIMEKSHPKLYCCSRTQFSQTSEPEPNPNPTVQIKDT
ncbi:hypothetical protein UlMin_020889 [Ulmus minor]